MTREFTSFTSCWDNKNHTYRSLGQLATGTVQWYFTYVNIRTSRYFFTILSSFRSSWAWNELHLVEWEGREKGIKLRWYFYLWSIKLMDGKIDLDGIISFFFWRILWSFFRRSSLWFMLNCLRRVWCADNLSRVFFLFFSNLELSKEKIT